jgi:hypothetical protein
MVSALYDHLSADGFEPWMDTRSLLPGEQWPAVIHNAISRCDFFILCLSSHSADRRGFLQKEIRQALDILDEMLDTDIFLIPVLLEECTVPARLQHLHWLTLSYPQGYDRLCTAIREGFARRFSSTSEGTLP